MMKTQKEIEEKIKELESDERLSYPTATIDINAPLALIQLRLESKIAALKWAVKSEEQK